MTNILTQSLWRDEAFSALLSIKNLGQIISITASDFSPPFYYLFLHFWIKLFGLGEVALRVPSVLFLLLTAWVTYLLGKRLFSGKVGVLAFFLVLLNPFLFYYAFEARMYTLLSLFSVLSFYFLIMENWPLFILFSLLGMYSHNFMVFSLLGELGAYFFLRGFGQKKYLLMSLGGIFLGFSPWLGILLSQARAVAGDFWIQGPRIREIFEVSIQFLVGPSQEHSRYLIFAAAALLLVLLWCFFPRREWRTEGRKITSLLIWASFPFFLSFVLSYVVPVFLPRYLIFVVIPLSLVLAFILTESSFPIPLIFCFLVLFLVRDSTVWRSPRKFPIREKVSVVSRSWQGEPVVCESILNFFEVKYYLLRFKPQASGKVGLLSSGAARYAGGSLVERDEILESSPEGSYFWVGRSGDIYLRKD